MPKLIPDSNIIIFNPGDIVPNSFLNNFQVLAYGGINTVDDRALYKDGSKILDAGYIPIVGQAIATKGYVDGIVQAGIILKGSVEFYTDLPAGLDIEDTGDAYIVLDGSLNPPPFTNVSNVAYRWSGTEWLPLGPIFNVPIQDGTVPVGTQLLANYNLVNDSADVLIDILSGDEAVGLATKAIQDNVGNIIVDTYETKNDSADKFNDLAGIGRTTETIKANADAITNIINGPTVVSKATQAIQDSNGNIIVNTYATKTALDAKTFTSLPDTPSGAELFLAKNFDLGVSDDGLKVVVKRPNNNSSYGVLSGCLLSQNGVNPNLFDIAPGLIAEVDVSDPLFPLTFVREFAGAIGVTPTGIATGTVSYISLKWNGTSLDILQRTTEYTSAQRRQEAVLGVFSHFNGIDINDIQSTPVLITQPLHSTLDYQAKIAKKDGLVYGGVIAAQSFNKSAGSLVGYGLNADIDQNDPNVRVVASQLTETFVTVHRDGFGGLAVSAPQTIFDPTLYDDGSGILATIGPPDANSVIHYIYTAGKGQTFIVYGQTIYGSLVLAEEARVAGTDIIAGIPTEALRNAVNTSVVILRKGAVDYSLATDAIFYTPVLSGGGGGGGSVGTILDTNVNITTGAFDVIEGLNQKLINEDIDTVLWSTIRVVDLVYVSAGLFKANLTGYRFEDTYKLTFRFPEVIIDPDEIVQVSVDDGVTPYTLKLKDTLNIIFVSEIQGQIADVFRNGTDVIINRMEPILSAEQEYPLPIQSQQSLVPVKNSPLGDYRVDGKSKVYPIINKGFATDVANWLALDGNVAIWDTGTARQTVVASVGVTYQEIIGAIGDVYYVSAKIHKYSGVGSAIYTLPKDAITGTLGNLLSSAEFDALPDGTTVYKQILVTLTNAGLRLVFGRTSPQTFDVSVDDFFTVKLDDPTMTLDEARKTYGVVGLENGLYSVENPEIKVTNKNVIKTDNLTNETINDSGVVSPSTGIVRDNNFTRIDQGLAYVYSSSGLQVGGQDIVLNRVVEYDSEFNFLRRVSISLSSPASYTPNSDAVYFEVYYRTASIVDITPADVIAALPMMELKSAIPGTTYLKNDNSSKKYNGQVLRDVSDGTNTVADWIDTVNNVLHRNIVYDFNNIIKNFTAWLAPVDVLTNTHLFRATTIDDLLGLKWDPISGTLVIGGISFTYVPTNIGGLDIDNSFNVAVNGTFNLRVDKVLYPDVATLISDLLTPNDVEFEGILAEELPPETIDSDGIAFAYPNMTLECIQDNGFGYSWFARHALNYEATVSLLAEAVKEAQRQIDALEDNQGDLSALLTTIKSNLVAAINEIFTNLGDNYYTKTEIDVLLTAITDDLDDNYYDKTEIDNLFTALLSGLDWKETVPTFADIATTYPTPEDGWTVNVEDTDLTYRYDGATWIKISSNSIPLATSLVDGLMVKTDKAKLDFIAATEAIDLDKVGERELLFTGSFAIPDVTAEPTFNITLLDDPTNYDEYYIVTNFGISNVIVANLDEAPVKVTGSFTTTLDINYKWKAHILSVNTMAVWYSRQITYATSYSNDPTTSTIIEQIYGIKY